MSNKILSKIDNKIGHITLNNPDKATAIDIEMRDTLIHAFHLFENNHDVSIIMLNANGKYFCAGADLQYMQHMRTVSYEENAADAKKLAELFYTIYSCKKPTITYAHGKVIGGGLGLLAASDIAIATPDTTFCFSEVKIGFIPAVISPFILQRLGYQSSKYYMMTAESFDAKTALKIGLIDRIGKNEIAHALAETLLQNNTQAVHALKKWLNALYPVTQSQMDQASEQLTIIRTQITDN